MPNYDFHALLEPLEFQDLICDTIQLRDNIFLETYKEGRDSGIDGSYSDKTKRIIVQAKRYRQDFKKLYYDLQYIELPKVRKLNPDRYILGVSMDFSPGQKEKIVDLFEGYIADTGDILSGKDINRLLREPEYKRIELAYPKLWLPNLNILEKTLKESVNRAIYKESAEELKEAIKASKAFVPTRIYRKALHEWSRNNVIVISGEPGVGKTTMAYLLALAHLQPDNWDGFIWANSIHDVYAMLEDEQEQVIILDDFWGSIFQDDHARRNDENRLNKLIRRILDYDGRKRLILTTREYILQQGLQKHPELRETLDAYALICTMEEYGEDEKASILFRHLYTSNLEYEYVCYFYANYEDIVYHRNYNPRVLATFLSKEPLEGYSPEEYFYELCGYLDEPSTFWKAIFVDLSPEAQIVAMLLLISSTPMLFPDLECCYRKYIHESDRQEQLKNLGDAVAELEKTMIKTFYSDEEDAILLKFSMPAVQDFLHQHIEDNNEQCIPLLLRCCAFYNQLQFLLEHQSSGCSGRVMDLIVEQCILHYQDYGNSFFEYDGSWNWDTDIAPEGGGALDRFFHLLRCCVPERHPALYHFLEKEIKKYCMTMGSGDREAQYTDLHNLPNIIVRCIRKGMSFNGVEIISKYKEEAFSVYHYLAMQEFQEVFPEEYEMLCSAYFSDIKRNIEDIIFSEMDFLYGFYLDIEFDLLIDSIPELLSKFDVQYTDEIEKRIFDTYGRKPAFAVGNDNMGPVHDEMSQEERAIQVVKEDAGHWLFGPDEIHLEAGQALEMIEKSNLGPELKAKLGRIRHCASPHYIYDFLRTKESGELLLTVLSDSDGIPKLESDLYASMIWNIGRQNGELVKKLIGFCAESLGMIMYQEEPVLRLSQFLSSDIYLRYLKNDSQLSEIVMENLTLQDEQWIRFLHIPLFIFCNVLIMTRGSEDAELEGDYWELWGENFTKYKCTSISDSGKETDIYYANIGVYHFRRYEWEGCMYRMYEELNPFHFNQSYVEPMLKAYLDDLGDGNDDSKVLKYISLCQIRVGYTEEGVLSSTASAIGDELALIEHLAIASDWNVYPESITKNKLKELEKDGVISQKDDKEWEILLYKIEDIELLKELGIYGEILRFINEVESTYLRFLNDDYSKIERCEQ